MLEELKSPPYLTQREAPRQQLKGHDSQLWLTRVKREVTTRLPSTLVYSSPPLFKKKKKMKKSECVWKKS